MIQKTVYKFEKQSKMSKFSYIKLGTQLKI